MTPEEHVMSVEQAIGEGYQRKVGELQRELRKAQKEAEERAKEADQLKTQNAIVVRDATEQLRRADAWVAQAAGGDWKQLTLVIGGAVSGFALGYYIQRAANVRVPFMSLLGVALLGTGMLMPRWHWSSRLALASSGALMGVGSVMYVLTVSDDQERPAAAGGETP
ncbi:MAG: hypothetical protein H6713_05755 [Myxococcales bacterium]|nr:hypothetical protein [Myxococcales bacterium]